MSTFKFLRSAVLAAAVLAVAATRAPADSGSSGGMLAASNGHGTIRLIWFPAVGHMPAGGWQLSEIAGGSQRTIVARISMGGSSALAQLSSEDAESIRQFSQKAASATTSRDLNDVYGVLGLKAFTSQAYASAAGLTWTVNNLSGGDRRYQVTGLGANGERVGPTLESSTVNPSLPTPLPPAPSAVRGISTLDGVDLFWNLPPQSREAPVLAYAIERDGGGQHGIAVTAKPLVLTVQSNANLPRTIDRTAPGDTQLTYHVYSIDAFGRRSAPASATFFAVDMKAIAPVLVSASAGQNETTLHWQPRENPHTAGYVVERSNLYEGPYVALTRGALGPRTGSYTDHSLRGGTVYYYRVLAVSPQGDLGPPSMAVASQPRNTGAPQQASGLHADAGSSRVHLTWHPSTALIAGYFVERRAGNDAHWETLNARVTPAPFYDDYVGVGTYGTLAYRVVSVGFDNRQAAPSDPVTVTLVDTSPPAMPYIRSLSGRNGVVLIALAPAAPASKTAYFIALRSGAKYRIGVVIGNPLPSSSHNFIDRNVEPGQDYWYRFAAVDRFGNRSELTNPVVVYVGSAPLPAPSSPVATYSSSPFAHVQISFGQIPHGLQVLVQRQVGGKGPWVLVAGPMPIGTKAIDANPPRRSRVTYRVVYQASNGARSSPSSLATLNTP